MKAKKWSREKIVVVLLSWIACAGWGFLGVWSVLVMAKQAGIGDGHAFLGLMVSAMMIFVLWEDRKTKKAWERQRAEDHRRYGR